MICKATNKAGEPCKAQAMANGYCYRHNPDISQEDKLLASASGGSHTSIERVESQLVDSPAFQLNEAKDLLDLLVNNINDLKAGKINPNTSNALVQNVGMIIKVYEASVQETRLRELEKVAGIKNPYTITSRGDN